MHDRKPTLARRTLMGGAATAGAVAAVAALSPKGPAQTAEPAQPAQPGEQPAAGYRLTDHVKRYYATARI